jgi:hypothetical protein
MKRIIRLTESDLVNLVKKVIKEQTTGEMANAYPISLKANPSFGGSSEQQMKLLINSGYLQTTQGKKPASVTSGIHKFINIDSPSAASSELKALVKNINEQLQRQKAQQFGGFYTIDIILDNKPGTFTMIK